MSLTIRIHIEHDGPLDGETPLPPNPTFQTDPSTGIVIVHVSPEHKFGRLEPGRVFAGQHSAELWLTHLSLVSTEGNHAKGSFVGMLGPTIPDVTPSSPAPLRLLDFGAHSETRMGIIPEGIATLVPVGHALVFDTRADGNAPGPHILQLTFDRPPRLPQRVRQPGESHAWVDDLLSEPSPTAQQGASA